MTTGPTVRLLGSGRPNGTGEAREWRSLASGWRVGHLDRVSKKEAILEAVGRLSADADFDEAIEEIQILRGIEAGEKAANEGNTVPHEKVIRLLSTRRLRAFQ